MVGRLAAVVALAGALLAPAAAAAPALPDGRALAVTASLSPDVHLFAEPVVARVSVVVDPGQLDPDRIRVTMRFPPYERLGEIQVSRRRVGAVVELAHTATLRCLAAGCLAPRNESILGELEGGRPERHAFRFPPAEIAYEHPGGRTELLLQRSFPPLEVTSRINFAELDSAGEAANELGEPIAVEEYRASLEPPRPTYRLGPRWLAGGALALAALLLALPAALAGRFLLERRRASRRPRRLSPLERALVLVEWTGRQADGEPDRRRALEALAAVLEESGAEPLAEAARTLAWAEDAPARERAGELADEARASLGRRGNGRAR